MNPLIIPIRQIGGGRTTSVEATYAQIVAQVGEPNVTDLDDDYKVPASWGFRHQDGREAFIWAYKLPKSQVKANTYWSADGDQSLLDELFRPTFPIYERLHEGDEVYWNDPDEGISSGTYTVTGIMGEDTTQADCILVLDHGTEVFRHELE